MGLKKISASYLPGKVAALYPKLKIECKRFVARHLKQKNKLHTAAGSNLNRKFSANADI
jgi:hypothetical protein